MPSNSCSCQVAGSDRIQTLPESLACVGRLARMHAGQQRNARAAGSTGAARLALTDSVVLKNA